MSNVPLASRLMLRPAGPSDRSAVLALARELADFPVPPWRTADEIRVADHPILEAALARTPDDQLLLVAERGAQVLGFVYAVTNRDYFSGELHAYVEDLAILPGARGLGLARELMQAVEDWALKRGYRRVRLAVWFQNQRARGLYEHLGYQPETMYYLKDLER
jgi:GNAT superfamily N-acetyltransferase